MSGHSKWHQIKRRKEITDAKRGQQFTRLAAHIKQAALAGQDPTVNPALAEAIARAKRANMPQANIDRLLTAAATSRQEITYEAFGPAGTALLILARTNNNRRTVAELRNILKNHGAKLGTVGSVAWKFNSAAPGHYTATYPLPLNNTAKQQVSQLLEDLNNHPDIEQIFTDAVD